MKKRVSIPGIAVVFLCLTLVTVASAADEILAKITVEAGEYKRVDTPICVSLEPVAEKIEDGGVYIRQVNGETKKNVPFQIEAGESPKLWWILSDVTEPGQKRVYELVKGSCSTEEAVGLVKKDKYIDVVKDGANVLRYNYGIVPPPLGQSKLYERSGFIHPLWSPTGAVLTDIHPPDHIHHVGIWMPWTKTEFEGKEIDFWNLNKGEGTVRFVKFLSTSSGPVYGGFQAEQEHVALKVADGEKVILREVWDVRVYDVGGPDKGYWLVDFKSIQRCIADSPLHQVEYRYGGFGFRGARQWKDEDSACLTSEGKTRVDGHATRACWCDNSGKIENWQGVTFYSHPENFRHPESMRIWPPEHKHVFFNFAPSQLGDWEMKPGEDHVFRYRLYVHEGKVNVKDVERIWHDYAEPPQVKLEIMQ
jgi:hypothetical protein